MSLPNLLKESSVTDAAWKRSARDLVNMTVKRLMDQGPTAERPKNPDVGTMFYEQTLGKPIWWGGSPAAWRDASGATV